MRIQQLANRDNIGQNFGQPHILRGAGQAGLPQLVLELAIPLLCVDDRFLQHRQFCLQLIVVSIKQQKITLCGRTHLGVLLRQPLVSFLGHPPAIF